MIASQFVPIFPAREHHVLSSCSCRIVLFPRIQKQREKCRRPSRDTSTIVWGNNDNSTRRNSRSSDLLAGGEESPRVQRAAPLLRVNSPPLGAPTCDACGVDEWIGRLWPRREGRRSSEAGEISLAIGKSPT